jgi:GNAT superfamily N-acetyltransferase
MLMLVPTRHLPPVDGSSVGECLEGPGPPGVRPHAHSRVVEISQDGPRRHDEWASDMKRVRDSAFGHSPLTIAERLSRRRRYFAESGRYPQALTKHQCWTVRAELNGVLVGYAWAYLVSDDDAWAYIDDVGVHADQQGSGVGRALIDEIVVWLRRSGVEHVSGLATDERMARIFGHHGIASKPW